MNHVVKPAYSQLVIAGVLIVAAVAGLAAAWCRPALAGTYTVVQCDHEMGVAMTPFSWQSSGVPSPQAHVNSGCLEFGQAVRTSGPGTSAVYADGAYGGYVASAPPGTVFRRFAGQFGTLVDCCVSGMEAVAEAVGHEADVDFSETIFRGPFPGSTWQAPSGLNGPVPVEWLAGDGSPGAERVGYFLRCDNASGCAQTPTGGLGLRGRSFEFTLEDRADPQIESVGGTLVGPGWIRGARELTVTGEDVGGGLASLSASASDQTLGSTLTSCVEVAGRYAALRPCPLSRSVTWEIDTRSLGDGEHVLDVRVRDVSGGLTDRQLPVKIDNSAPSAPTQAWVEGGDGWRQDAHFAVRWSDESAQNAPIARVHYRVCAVPGGECEVGSTTDLDGSDVEISVTEPGTYNVGLWLEDEAGNVDDEAVSSPVLVRFDDRRPAQARVAAPGGWMSGESAAASEIVLDVASDGVPVSGIGGYSLTVDGTDPDETIDLVGPRPRLSLHEFPEGETVVRARAASGSGRYGDAGTVQIRVDRSPPSITAANVPDVSTWSTRPVRIELASADQPGLSGLAPAPFDEPAAHGGYLTVGLNNEAPTEFRGGRAQVPIAQDGHHTLRYRAFDAAGNGSVEKEVAFKIDRTAPVGAFRALDAGDPRQLRVDVSDATSGVADGWIEYRREGESGFRRLDTTRSGGVLSGRLDDQALPPGRYALRAVVTDVAGNEAIVDSWTNGSAATLGMPLRLDASLTVAGVAKAKAKAKKRCGKARKSRKRTKRRPKCRQAKPRPKASLALPHGRRARSTGRLVTGQSAPIAGATVVVEGQARSGGPFVALGSTRTDNRGELRYTIPAGPSRTIRYRYDGTNTVRPAAAQLTTKVTAAARLKVDRRRLRNGQSVRFSGRLLGKPIPAAGKLVALQAKVGRGWRTFATPRANAKGVFRHRYRFTATTGVRRYAFRAVIAREDAYPYERGVSRIVRVTVKGGR